MGAGIRADAQTGFLDLSHEPTDAAKRGHKSQSTGVDDIGPRHRTLADVLAQIETAKKLTPVARRDLKSAVTRVAKWLNHDLSQTPADPAWLREHMADWNGARFGISDASFSVVLSQLRRALGLTAPSTPRLPRSKLPLLPEWHRLDAAMRRYWIDYRNARDLPVGNNWLAIRLARFIRWCSEHAIFPTDVRDETIVGFINDIKRQEIRGRIDEKEVGLRKAWNHAVKHIPGWPNALVKRPPHS